MARPSPKNGNGEIVAAEGTAAIVIDDQRRLAELLAERLAMDGFETTVATTATEALKICGTRSYEVAFIDLQLPDMSGIAAASELKKMLPKLRVILMTGFAASLNDLDAHWSHVDAVLPKPWRPAELSAILRALGKDG